MCLLVVLQLVDELALLNTCSKTGFVFFFGSSSSELMGLYKTLSTSLNRHLACFVTKLLYVKKPTSILDKYIKRPFCLRLYINKSIGAFSGYQTA